VDFSLCANRNRIPNDPVASKDRRQGTPCGPRRQRSGDVQARRVRARERTDDAACRRFPLRRVIFAPGQRLTAAAKQARANRKSFHPGQVFVEIRAGGIIPTVSVP
jgi:hypothetical protein